VEFLDGGRENRLGKIAGNVVLFFNVHLDGVDNIVAGFQDALGGGGPMNERHDFREKEGVHKILSL
jgi:hypothetical protein